MQFGTFDVTAPAILGGEFNEGEVFGSAVWLWMHSASHREAPLHTLSALLLPALKNRQFVFATEQGKPVFYRPAAFRNGKHEQEPVPHRL